ncbi:MAG: acetyltransferase component of pyruvate dehydrogenase complex [Pseudomonadota bacterium]|jgi:pyruvate dehydrogenase E2 component (dihydrolipoamide acetyltransferase)
MANDIQVAVPDIGDFEAVDVIEVLVKPGDIISAEDPLITLESDKATMDIPAPLAGRVVAISVKVGDKVSEGNLLLTVEPLEAGAASAPAPVAQDVSPARPAEPVAAAAPAARPAQTPVAEMTEESVSAVTAPASSSLQTYGFESPDPGPRTLTPPGASLAMMQGEGRVHASPGIRKFARELGVTLNEVKGSGPKGRILKEDVTAHVKRTLQAPPATTGLSLPMQQPEIDFSRFGPTSKVPLTKIRRLTGQNLHRAWVSIPHVTQFDEADITELEAFRKAKGPEAEQSGARLTLVAFILKALVAALRRYPDFNSSLSGDGSALIHKQYFHLGVAVNTERGLLVPVIRDVDQKGILALARELREISGKARDGKLTPAEMQGGCMTVTSLGGVGGTAFTPIILPPEVAILGVSPASLKPVWSETTFVPRLMLPLSLSYDHRVIDGVAGAEFARYLCRLLGDIRELML